MVSSPEGLTSCSTYMSLLLDTVNMFRAVRVILRAAWAGKAKKKKKQDHDSLLDTDPFPAIDYHSTKKGQKKLQKHFLYKKMSE